MKFELDTPTFFVCYDEEKEARVECSMVELSAMGLSEGERVKEDRLAEFFEIRDSAMVTGVLLWETR